MKNMIGGEQQYGLFQSSVHGSDEPIKHGLSMEEAIRAVEREIDAVHEFCQTHPQECEKGLPILRSEDFPRNVPWEERENHDNAFFQFAVNTDQRGENWIPVAKASDSATGHSHYLYYLMTE